ncbi:MAG: hypothetical protein D6702_08785 [Planctomycetota bacterium]|nr:MAG: hypothetical protein D6702_08785 [Planctomycetota bacterium]
MRTLTRFLPLLLLGSCANLIVGEAQGGATELAGGDLAATAPLAGAGQPELAPAPQPDAPDAEWRRKRGQVLRTFAFRALERGLIEEARGYLQEACELDRTDVESHCALARLFLSEGDTRTALIYAERAATAQPDNPGARLVYAATLAEAGENQAADEQAELAWQASGHDPDLIQALVTHYAAEDRGAAQDFVDRVLAEHPRDARSWMAAGDLFLAQGQVEQAATAYAQAISLDPRTPTPSVLAEELGRTNGALDPVVAAAEQAERDGDLAGAERLYRFLAQAHPGDPELQAGLARVLWRRGRIEAAAAALETIDFDRRGWREHLLDAKIRFQRRDWAGARGALKLVLELRPELRAAELLLGEVERRLAGSAAGDRVAESEAAPAEPAAAVETAPEQSVEPAATPAVDPAATAAAEPDPIFGQPRVTEWNGVKMEPWTVVEDDPAPTTDG